ncbi:hypothetical protein DICPUDRAFT_43460 [Dictyostelium purpureum]|uniref:RNA ligase domain-containing protein n=1 Tax=Dictyostelium purpureum TaxID=5786 RepID=F1A456_DICPU|nr:uncharacterized protein DICPUDRAFT_43460 [Dictyostelium purpureum]EGC29022.1 hypothetical protein DICPUDRAFT_43460 [Dictyostelium purpureum]|eukprot:XP_003294450.1 hypothetical protein DICPUDRAFT_43460 [Dictyostelium purpureum]
MEGATDNSNNNFEQNLVEIGDEEGRDYLNESGRPLAYFHQISNLEAIEGADIIEIATVLGWRVIVKKGLYKIGDSVVYVEIDSLLPSWPYFVSDGLDKKSFKIKTIKLRGQISQGYCIPVKELLNHPNKKVSPIYHSERFDEIIELKDETTGKTIPIELGYNLTEFIGIKKIEEYVPTIRTGPNKTKIYTFPSFIKKTDQGRIQNLLHYFDTHKDKEFEVTEKLEGSSITVYRYKDKNGICSRNYQLEKVEPSTDIHQAIIEDLDLINKLIESNLNIAIQGEIIGPKIQGNIYALKKHHYKIFDIYLIEKDRYATYDERIELLQKLGLTMKDHGAPILFKSFSLNGKTLKDILELADGFSQLKESKPKVLREGLVFKSLSTHNDVSPYVVSFKAISNQYLLKKK